MSSYDEPLFLISVVAKMLAIHPQTLRQYEREGLIVPSRTEGKMRLYSSADVERIKMILRLTRDLGVNLAGVDIVLQLKDEIIRLEGDLQNLRAEFCKTSDSVVPSHKSLVVKKSAYDIVVLKH